METLIEQLERAPVPVKPTPPPNRIVREAEAGPVLMVLVVLALGSIAWLAWAISKLLFAG